MIDPFPFPPPVWLTTLVQPIADFFSMTTLPLHAHEILLAFTFYHLLCTTISPAISKRIFPRTYGSFDGRARINWDVHVVSLVQSVFIVCLAFYIMWYDEQRATMNWKGRVFGYTGSLGLLQACATGYFLWDLYVSVRHIDVFGVGLLAHAISALAVYALGYRPFVNYYGPNFILYELSSPFLNIHWFFDKLKMTGSRAQLYNGIILLTSFFGCRLIWGLWQSGQVAYDVYRAVMAGHIDTSRIMPGGVPDMPAVTPHMIKEVTPEAQIMRFAGTEQVPLWLAASYLSANIVLSSLNFFWFNQMIAALRKRFDPPFGTRGVVKGSKRNGIAVDGKVSEVEVARGIDAAGRTSVQVQSTETRKRRPG